MVYNHGVLLLYCVSSNIDVRCLLFQNYSWEIHKRPVCREVGRQAADSGLVCHFGASPIHYKDTGRWSKWYMDVLNVVCVCYKWSAAAFPYACYYSMNLLGCCLRAYTSLLIQWCGYTRIGKGFKVSCQGAGATTRCFDRWGDTTFHHVPPILVHVTATLVF